MATLSQTLAAAGYLTRHAPAALTRSRALLLEEKLIACGNPLSNAAAPSPGLLRQIVIAVRDLAGPAWLHAHAGDPGIHAFTSLDSTPTPPSPLVLDEILTRCLRARFGPHLPAR
jgi:hypothetical protein